MRWSYDLAGAEPIIRDWPVWDATSLNNGEHMMITTDATGASGGFGTAISSYNATSASGGVNGLGILQESTYASSISDRDFSNTSGVNLGKIIINPLAVYRAEISQDATEDVACEGSTTTTNIYETIATNDEAIGCYLYFTAESSTAAIQGCLRQITDNTTTYAVVPALPATPATTDDYIIIQPAGAEPGRFAGASVKSIQGTSLSSLGTLTDVLSNNVGNNFRIVQSWVEATGFGFAPLNGYLRDNHSLGNMKLGTDAKFYSDIINTNHLFNSLTVTA